jgi:hypothetical protein
MQASVRLLLAKGTDQRAADAHAVLNNEIDEHPDKISDLIS